MKQKIVVTGAGGFIGRRVVDAALAAGYSVTAVHRPGKQAPASRPHLTIAEWDAENAAPPGEIFDAAKAVCHLAAFVPPDMSAAVHAERCVRVNALGTLRLLDVIRDRKIHLVHVSAGQLYRRQGRLAHEGDEVVVPLRAPYYLSSKLLSEMYVDYFAERYDVPITKLRPGSVYGPGMHRGAVHKFLQLARAGLPIEITANNPYAVDLVFVDDVVRVILAVIDKRALGTFNVGSGAATRIEQLGREALSASAAKPGLLKLTESRLETDPGFDALDIERARNELAYSPTPLGEGMRRTAEAISQCPSRTR